MSKPAKFSIQDCIFQFYMDHQVPNGHGRRVHNVLLDRDVVVKPNLWPEVDRKFTLVRDVPDYLIFEPELPAGTKSIKIPQYPGYLIDLRGYQQIDDFLKGQLSKRNVKNLHNKKRGLEKLGQVEYRILSGPMEENVYATAFETFYALLKKRFDRKRILNRELDQWEQLYRQAYPRLMENKAILFIIALEGKPICMALDYILENSVFSHIQTYDMEYARYNLGDIHMLFQLQWCLDHGKAIFDMSKGRNPYKEKWCNHSYRFHHEIIYRPGSMTSSFRARMTALNYASIQKLRDLGILGNIIHVDKLMYLRQKNRIKDQIHIKTR